MHHIGKLTTGTIALALLTVLLTGLAPTAAAKPGGSGPNCYQVYIFEGQVGPVTVDASDSCPEVEVDPDWRPSVSESSTIPPCAGITDEESVGPARVWLNDICQVGVFVDAGPAGSIGADTDRNDGEDLEYEPGATPADGGPIHCYYDPKTLQGYCWIE